MVIVLLGIAAAILVAHPTPLYRLISFLPGGHGPSASIQPDHLAPATVAADASAQPLGVQFPATSLANRLALLWWLVVVELLGVVTFPLAYLAFPGFRDRGWGLSKALGLLLLGFLVWLPANLGLVMFDRSVVLLMLGVIACASAVIVWRVRDEMVAFMRTRWKLLVACEGAFLVVFLLVALVRALDPNLFFPDFSLVPNPQFPHYYSFSGEKPFEMSFITALLRSRTLPPYDAWFSGSYVNYYYYGIYLYVVLIKLTGITPTVAFNLSLALLGGISFSSAFSVVTAFSRRWWAGLLGGFAFIGAGNLDGLGQVLGQIGAKLHGKPLPFYDYWQSAHLVPGIINEWPGWSLVFGDLHPHLIDPVFCVVVIACCSSLLLTTRNGAHWLQTVPTLCVATLTLGTIWCTNTWDLPAFALLFAVALAFRVLRIDGRHERWRTVLQRASWKSAAAYVALLATVMAGAYLLFLPFHQQFQVILFGIGGAREFTTPQMFATLFGLWLFLLMSFFAVELADRWRAPITALARQRGLPPPLVVLVMVLLVLVLATVLGAYEVKLGLLMLIIVGLYLGLNPRHPPVKQLTYILVLLGLTVALGVELFYFRDYLQFTSQWRQNTVFKFWIQVWTCFSIGGALAFLQVVGRVFGVALVDDVDASVVESDTAAAQWGERLPLPPAPVRPHRPLTESVYRLPRAARRLHIAWLVACAVLIFGSTVFVVEGTYNRAQDPQRWSQVQRPPDGIQPQGLSLDGMAFMRGWYPGDYAAITWMNEHIGGTPIIVEAADRRAYTWYGRVSAYTGLPAVIGWGAHEIEWHAPAEAKRHLLDVQAFWGTSDPTAALAFLRNYHVSYVYVGALERECYMLYAVGHTFACRPMSYGAIAKLQTLVDDGDLTVVYSNPDVTLYKVEGQ